jgi:hypothetical protein
MAVRDLSDRASRKTPSRFGLGVFGQDVVYRKDAAGYI